MHGPTCIFWANLTPFLLKGAPQFVRFGWTREADQCVPPTYTGAHHTHNLRFIVLHTQSYTSITPHTCSLCRSLLPLNYSHAISAISAILAFRGPTRKEPKDGLAFRFMQGASDRLSMGGGGATSPGRHCHSTQSLTAIDCHSLGLYTGILLALLPLSVKITACRPGLGATYGLWLDPTFTTGAPSHPCCGQDWTRSRKWSRNTLQLNIYCQHWTILLDHHNCPASAVVRTIRRCPQAAHLYSESYRDARTDRLVPTHLYNFRSQTAEGDCGF